MYLARLSDSGRLDVYAIETLDEPTEWRYGRPSGLLNDCGWCATRRWRDDAIAAVHAVREHREVA
jgi:hypothetical protein